MSKAETVYSVEFPEIIMQEILKQTGLADKREAAAAIIRYGLTFMTLVNDPNCKIMVQRGDEPPDRVVRNLMQMPDDMQAFGR